MSVIETFATRVNNISTNNLYAYIKGLVDELNLQFNRDKLVFSIKEDKYGWLNSMLFYDVIIRVSSISDNKLLFAVQERIKPMGKDYVLYRKRDDYSTYPSLDYVKIEIEKEFTNNVEWVEIIRELLNTEN